MSAWVLWIIGGIFTLIVVPFVSNFLDHMAENYGWYDREALPNAINVFLNLAEQPWFRTTALVVGGFVAGMLVDRLLRKLDGSRADKKKAIGTDMVALANNLSNLRDPMRQGSPQIRSCFTAARKLGIWAPDQQVFIMHQERVWPLIRDYLLNVGTMLWDGHFSEAKQQAVNGKAAFANAYKEHGLSFR